MPVALRYANSTEIPEIKEKFYSDDDYSKLGVIADFEKDNVPNYVFISYGNITSKVIEAQKMLKKDGIESGIILVEKLKPYSESVDKIYSFIKGAKKILFVEEGIKNGGFSMIAENALREKYDLGCECDIAIRAIDDNFVIPDKKCDVYEYLGFSPEALSFEIKNIK